jgi:hypothetical protein
VGAAGVCAVKRKPKFLYAQRMKRRPTDLVLFQASVGRFSIRWKNSFDGKKS